MNCNEIIHLMPSYQDNDLPLSQGEAVRRHLDNCANCRKEERLLAQTWNLLDDVPSISPSLDFRDRLWKRIEDEKRGWLPFPATAAVVSVLFLWGAGAVGGVALFKSQMSAAPSMTERSVALFTSPAPQNSIEEIFLSR